MATLVEIVTRPAVRPQVVRACESLIEAEVASKSGLSALALKAGYKLVRAIKPTMVGEVVDHLLPEFAAALEPFLLEAREAEARERGRRTLPQVFEARVAGDPARVAAALLSVTDARAARASGPLKKTYERLRSTADEHVRAAVPGLARALAPFAE